MLVVRPSLAPTYQCKARQGEAWRIVRDLPVIWPMNWLTYVRYLQ